MQSTPRTSPGVDATRATQRHAATSAGPNASAFAGKKRRKKRRKRKKKRGKRAENKRREEKRKERDERDERERER